MVTGFTAGTFDLFHAGHITMLEECSNQCDYLIVAIQTNPHLDRKEKSKPIQSIVERQIEVGSCIYVDEIIVYETEKDLEELLSVLPIDIRFVGVDHYNGFMTGENICKARDIEIIYTSRDHDFSTSELKGRIKC